MKIIKNKTEFILSILGYDTIGTKTTADDVLIFADSYDTADHYQDGYGIENGENFFWSWFDHQILPEDERKHPFVLAYPKEKITSINDLSKHPRCILWTLVYVLIYAD